jgi:hypothetical protein
MIRRKTVLFLTAVALLFATPARASLPPLRQSQFGA